MYKEVPSTSYEENMLTVKDRQAFADVSIIIKMMPDNMKEKISKEFIEMIEKNKDGQYLSSINYEIPIREQKLEPTTEILLSLIYLNFICNEEERKKLMVQERMELAKYEEDLKYKYVNPSDKIYNRKIGINNKNIENNLEIKDDVKSEKSVDKDVNKIAIVENKKINLFTKLLHRIRKFFKR